MPQDTNTPTYDFSSLLESQNISDFWNDAITETIQEEMTVIDPIDPIYNRPINWELIRPNMIYERDGQRYLHGMQTPYRYGSNRERMWLGVEIGEWLVEYVALHGSITPQDGDIFYSDFYDQLFKIHDFANSSYTHKVEWLGEINSLEGDYTGWENGIPFQRDYRWYVAFDAPRCNEGINVGGAYFDSNMGQEYELYQRMPASMFGSYHGYSIEWLEPEPEYYDEDYDDGSYYSDRYSHEIVVENEAVIPRFISTNRKIPLVSFEQEFSGNGQRVAEELHRANLCVSPYVEGYHGHEGRRDTGDAICYVETDSSCGYELIFSKLDLTNRRIAEDVSRAQQILRHLKDDGHISLSAACGFHVHLDVSDWGMKEIVSAYHLWNYLEDVIFRFSSAFWGMHRDEETGRNYSTPVPKGLNTRREVGRHMAARRDALNFSPILSARGDCTCNATFYEDWANCTCNVRQPTLEFRVFNGTINQRKIKAYIAFCIAFCNHASSIEADPVNYPVMHFAGTNNREVAHGHTSWEASVRERINYILTEFPFTSSEKTDIMYCLRNCSLESVLETL